MFIHKEDNKMELRIPGQTICTLDVDKHLIQNTYNTFITTLQRIAQWKKPEFKLLYPTEQGESGIMTLSDKLYTVGPIEKKITIKQLDYNKYGISQMADIETVIFVLAEEFVRDIKTNLEILADIITGKSKNADKLEVMTKLLQMAANIEKMKKLAMENYDVPEYIKGILIDEDMEQNNIWETKK